MHVSCVFRTSAEGNTPRGVPHRVQSNVDAAETPSDGLMPQSHLATLTSLFTVHITSYINIHAVWIGLILICWDVVRMLLLCLCHGKHSTETKAAHTGQTTTLTACNDIFPLPFLRGLDNPSRPRPCCTLACRCGRGPTQGTCKRELTAEGLLPSMRIWMRIIFVHVFIFSCHGRHSTERQATLPDKLRLSLLATTYFCNIFIYTSTEGGPRGETPSSCPR